MVTLSLVIVYLAGAIGVFGTVDPVPPVPRLLLALLWPVMMCATAVLVVADLVRER